MKTCQVGMISLVFGAAWSVLCAQAPESIAGTIYYEEKGYVTARFEETTVFRADGTYQILAHRAIIGRIPVMTGHQLVEEQSYTYAKTGPGTAVITSVSTGLFRNAAGFVERELRFTSATSGTVTLVGPHVGLSGEYSGTFDLRPLAPEPPLLNLSSRGMVTPGKPLIAGFVIAPGPARCVLVRAVGPGMVDFGVSDAAPDPEFTLFSRNTISPYNESGNNDWEAWRPAGSTSETLNVNRRASLRNLYAFTGAFELVDGSKDAAAFFHLQPGNYTVHVSPRASTPGGEALVEVYLLP